MVEEVKNAGNADDKIVGNYIIHGYENNKNDWHYVEISVVDANRGVYRWQNRANVKWTLTQKPNEPTKFEVGTDCPYH